MLATPWRRWLSLRLCLIASLLIAAVLAGAGLNRHPFWDDEAETALFARNIAEHGTRSAWDGNNVAAFRGGINLDEHLIQADVPPLQYYVAAASFRLFGAGTVTGRLPFLLCGLIALWLLDRWAATYLGPQFPSWLPSLLLALNVPFLLYIAQCRYYALALLSTAGLLWAWSAAERGIRPRLACLGGALAMIGLFESNYMDAVAMACALGAGLVHPAQWRRSSLLFLGAIGLALAAAMAELMLTHDVVGTWNARRGEIDPLARFWILLSWQVQGLGPFEFFPVLPLPLLVLPWVMKRLAPLRPVSGRALLALLMIPVIMIVIAVLSPQDPKNSPIADMRYDLPIFVIGAVITASAIHILAAAGGRAAAALAAGVIVMSNAAYLGSDRLQCTLCERLREIADSHPSGTGAMLQAATGLTPGTSVVVRPAYMTLSLMFYRPDLRFPGVLDPQKALAPETRALLPSWVYCCAEPPDVLLVGHGSVGPNEELPTGGHEYAMANVLKLFWFDRTRPELPWHSFRYDDADDQRLGILVFKRKD
jgi:4-amino-4-deoxy-L-arabinose transferase-like glycosyltransferase